MVKVKIKVQGCRGTPYNSSAHTHYATVHTRTNLIIQLWRSKFDRLVPLAYGTTNEQRVPHKRLSMADLSDSGGRGWKMWLAQNQRAGIQITPLIASILSLRRHTRPEWHIHCTL